MDIRTRGFLRKCILEISNKSIAKYFIKIPQAGIDVEEDYSTIVKEPKALESILELLDQNGYPSYNSFLKDTEIIWSNCEKYYGKNHYFTFVARELRRQLQRLCRPVSITTPLGFAEETYRLRTKLEQLIEENPFDTKKGRSVPFKPDAIKQIPSVNELYSFIEAQNLLTKQEDFDEIRNIISHMQVELVPNTKIHSIDVTKMRPDTFYAVKTYIKDVLQRDGLTYPE